MNTKRWFLLAMLLGLISLAAAAQNPRVPSVERRIETLNRHAKEYDRDVIGRDGKPLNKAEAEKRTRQIRAEIKEDLDALQAAYNHIIVSLQDRSEALPGSTYETAHGVKKRAERLMNNLELPSPSGEGEEQKAVGPIANERASLRVLARSLYDFITNPIFDDTAVMDAKHGAKARIDLAAVIGIAGQMTETFKQ